MRPSHSELQPLLDRYGRGGIARVNHGDLDTSCTGSSRSLKLSERDGGISYRCFRCGASGVAYPSAVVRRAARHARGDMMDNTEVDDTSWKHVLPDGVSDPLEWSKPARDWLLSYLTVAEARSLGAVEARNRLWLPVLKDGIPVKWAGRMLHKDDRVKYLTGQAPGYTVHDPYGVQTPAPLVIVEDIVSAVSVASRLRVPAYPVLSTSMSTAQVNHLYFWRAQLRLPRTFVVWLDNDNAQVNRASRYLVNTFRGYGCRVHREQHLGDPKTALSGVPYSGYSEITETWSERLCSNTT